MIVEGVELNTRRCSLVLVMSLFVLTLVGSQLALIDVVHAARARPGYPLMSLNQTFTSHLISYPTASSTGGPDPITVDNPSNCFDADISTVTHLNVPGRADTAYFDLTSFDTAVLQSPVTKADIHIHYNATFGVVTKDWDQYRIQYDRGDGTWTDLVAYTSTPAPKGTYHWQDKTVTNFANFKIRFEFLNDAAVDPCDVYVFEVWVTQKIDPSTTFPTPTPNYDSFINGTPFGVNIRVSDINATVWTAGLGGYSFKLWYNTTVLTCTGITYITTWFPTNLEWFKEINDALGRVALDVTLASTPTPRVTGSGDVVTINFSVDQAGASALYLNETGLATWEVPAVPIPHEKFDGHYSFPPFDPSTSPVAGFNFSPSSPLVDQTINFDASTPSTSKPSANTVSGITVNNPTKAYDWNFGTYADFTRNADGYFEISGFSSPTIPAGFSIFRVDLHVKFEADLSSAPFDQDQYKIYYLVGPSSTETDALAWKYFATPLGNYTYFDLTEPNNGAWSATDVTNVKVRFGTDVRGTTEDLDVNVYEVWLEVQTGGSYARSPWTSPYQYGEGRGWLYSYTWDFDDGSSVTTVYGNPTIDHTYSTADTYTVNLTVTDRYGLTSYYTYDVTVVETVPEFPLGAPVYVALAIVIFYVWWKSRRKTNTVGTYGK